MRKYNVVPPFRALDPGLATAERLLAAGHPELSAVVHALPDERVAAAGLNALLAATGARPRLVADGRRWRVVHVGAFEEVGELVAAASGLAELVAVDGWRRIKACPVCGQVFCDRTSGATRRWCDAHRPHGRQGTVSSTPH
ncbi:CGNR zinc finger domain-containing protein [Amycolatopsis marina]|uniref:CGNR zinc finger domain-containing protein n=1 Tax=Amycolatopsis marina TaxID=490629 RepID=A0A1I0YAF4_9PSEU|nr:CGNR zinc finger domain-containing protein [Amycolatopsis marina]SFB09173.1 CGNR zinc finger domain-containing protein [Amycolatopsis marina]